MQRDIPLEAIECLSLDELEALQTSKLTTLLELAREHSPFYRQHLRDSDPRDLSSIPPLTKEMLVRNSPPESSDLLTGPLEAAYVFRSGGTTGNPKFSPFSVEEFRRFTAMFMRAYGGAGLRPSDRVANLFVSGSLYASFLFVNRCLEEMGCLNFPFTGSAPMDVIARNVELFPINTLMGIPSWVLEIVQRLPEAVLPKIEKVFFAGEHLYPEERNYLYERLPNLSVIASGGYGAVDTGLMGFQCPHCEGSIHHVLSDHTLLEVVDPVTWRPVAIGEEGVVLVTTLDRIMMPLIRYVIGDVARIMPGGCPCGRTAPRFELLGRNDDVRIGIATVGYDEIMGAVAEFGELTSNLQLVKEREEMKDRLVVRVELRPDAEANRSALAASLLEAVYRHKPDLAKLAHAEHVQHARVEVFDLGAIARVPVTGKIRRTLDKTLD